MFSNGYKIRFLCIGVFFLLFYFPSNIYAATSLNDYPKIKDLWNDGELVMAIDKLKSMAKDKPKDDEIFELLKKVTFQKSKLDEWINKGTNLLKQEKFEEAKSILDFAKEISPNYKPYLALMDEIKRTQDALKYPIKVVFDGESFGSDWKPYEKDEKFSNYGKFENSTLLLDIPEGRSWGRVGLESNDTIVNVDTINDLKVYHFKFNFDSENTTSFVIELEGENLDKKSRCYANISATYKQMDENNSILELHKDGKPHGRLEMNTAVPEYIELVIQPNNFAYLKLPDGKFLQTTSIKYPMPEKGYRLKVYSIAREYKLATKMALESIEMQIAPFKKRFNLSNLDKNVNEIVLFDGKYFEDIWMPVSKQTSQDRLIDYAQFNNDGFIIDIPANNKLSRAGIVTAFPIWLDKLENESEIKTTFLFDPNETSGFSLFVGEMNPSWNVPYGKNIDVSYYTLEDQNISKLIFKIENKIVLDANVTSLSKMIFYFEKNKISISSDTLEKKSFEWKYLDKNRPLHLFAYTNPYKTDLPVKMALRKIILEKNLNQNTDQQALLNGVLPIPEKNIFNANHIDDWECREGKDKENYCTMSDVSFAINVPKESKNSSSIRSKNKIINLDARRINTATLKMVMQFNPKKTDNFDITIGHEHIYFEKTQENMYTLRLGRYLSRNIQAEWIETQWNGKINILFSKDSIEVEMDENIGINIPQRPLKDFDIKISTTQSNSSMKNGSNLVLENITTQWLAPDGMNAVDRWNYINDEDFDPDAFLNELREVK